MPLMIPTGMAKSAPRLTTMIDPMTALAMPPPTSPTGFGISVKKPRLSEVMPCVTT